MALPLNAFHTLDTEFNKTITWKQTVNVNGGKIRETFQRGAHVNSIDNHAMGNWNKSFYTVDNSICNCTKKKKHGHSMLYFHIHCLMDEKLFLKFVNLRLL